VVPTCVYVFRGKQKTLITLFTKLKAYFKPVLQKIDKIHRLLYAIICSVHMYSCEVFKLVKPTNVRTWGLKWGESIYT